MQIGWIVVVAALCLAGSGCTFQPPEPPTSGLVLQIGENPGTDLQATAGGQVLIPLYLDIGDDVTSWPASITAELSYDPAVIAPVMQWVPGDVYAAQVDPSSTVLLDLWYGGEVLAGAAVPAPSTLEVSAYTIGLPFPEITGVDDQRGLDSTHVEQVPFPLGSVLCNVVGDAGTQTALTLTVQDMSDGDLSPLTHYSVRNGTLRVVSP